MAKKEVLNKLKNTTVEVKFHINGILKSYPKMVLQGKNVLAISQTFEVLDK